MLILRFVATCQLAASRTTRLTIDGRPSSAATTAYSFFVVGSGGGALQILLFSKKYDITLKYRKGRHMYYHCTATSLLKANAATSIEDANDIHIYVCVDHDRFDPV